MKTALVVAPLISGHRSTYIRLIVEQARADGWRVILATRRHGDGTYQQEQPSPSSWPHEFATIDSSRLAVISEISRQYRPTVTIVPDGDTVAAELGFRGRWSGYGTLSLLVMRPATNARAGSLNQALRQELKLLLLKRARKVPRTRVYELRSALSPEFSTPGSVSDPIEYCPSESEVVDVRRRLGIDDERFWFAILGAITERKCIPEVIGALDRAAGFMPGPNQAPPALLLAGKLSENVKKYISELPDYLKVHLRVLDQRLTDEELDDLIRAVDCVVIAHRNEGPSGIMGKAGVAGARVLAAGARSLKEDCAQGSLGRIWTPLDLVSFSKAAVQVQGQPKPKPVHVPGKRDFWRTLSAQW